MVRTAARTLPSTTRGPSRSAVRDHRHGLRPTSRRYAPVRPVGRARLCIFHYCMYPYSVRIAGGGSTVAAILKSRAPAITAAGERPLPPPLRPIGEPIGNRPSVTSRVSTKRSFSGRSAARAREHRDTRALASFKPVLKSWYSWQLFLTFIRRPPCRSVYARVSTDDQTLGASARRPAGSRLRTHLRGPFQRRGATPGAPRGPHAGSRRRHARGLAARPAGALAQGPHLPGLKGSAPRAPACAASRKRSTPIPPAESWSSTSSARWPSSNGR